MEKTKEYKVMRRMLWISLVLNIFLILFNGMIIGQKTETLNDNEELLILLNESVLLIRDANNVAEESQIIAKESQDLSSKFMDLGYDLQKRLVECHNTTEILTRSASKLQIECGNNCNPEYNFTGIVYDLEERRGLSFN